jgi:predicted dehydrogenase
MSKIRLGVIGAGEIGRLTARDFSRHPDAEIVAVADLNHDRASDLAEKFSADVADHPDTLIARGDLDAVYVAVPNKFHEEVACSVLDSGKHLMLDKPFAIDLAAAQRIAAAAQASNRTLFLGMNQRFERNVQRARLLADAGTFGNIYHVKAYWRRRQGIPRMGSWFTNKDTAGGGALLDIGVHVLDVALHVLDNFSPVSVSGAAFTRFGNRGLGEGGWGRSEREYENFDVDDFATAMIRLDGGQVITLEAAWALHQPSANEHDVLIYGENAGMAIYADQLFRDGADGGYQIIQGASSPELPFPHCNRATHFINVLLGREAALVTVDQALAVQKILDAIYQSSACGREVMI